MAEHRALPRQEDTMRNVLEKIKQAKADSKPRKFKQTWDLSINLKNVDLKKPENRFKFDFMLPEGRGKELKVCVIADSLATEAKGKADLVITKDEIEPLGKNKKTLKTMAKEYDWFLGEASLMAQIGKSLGQVLGTRGKMPKPVPPKVSIDPFIGRAKKSTMIAVKDSPVVHVSIGSEDMEPEKIATNAEAVYRAVLEKLPKGRNSIKSAFVKMTMGKPVKVEVL
jgi:large subunit ribosomal protein L1